MTAPDPRHERVKAVFESARTLPREQRAAHLEAACAGDAALLADVRSLLESWDDADGFMDGAALEPGLADFDGAAAPIPRRIGGYRITRLLGAGGMGTVYEAEQESPHRLVAIKIVTGVFARPELARRFQREIELLGRLRHPGIAQVHEAGSAELIDADGVSRGDHPYFAMELIDGRPLTEHAFAASLDRTARLELFADVCDAVHAAHRSGVIHRDLKPGNILVDGSGRAKILDFGIARPTDVDAPATLRTETGRLVGTLPYMSPEQVTGRPADVDTRSDVYSLGVILYELLSGRLPYDVRSSSIPEAARIISEQEPTRLDPTTRHHRGDLETIVETALRKDPDERYASAAELAADVRRFLRDEPIVARPASTWYQLRKFARRNRALVGGVAGIAVALVAGTVVSAAFAIGQMRARANAERQTKIAIATVDFLTEDVLGAPVEWGYGNTQVTMREALDAAAGRVGDRFTDEPLVEAAVRMMLARSYRHLALPEAAAEQAEHALRLRRRALGARAVETTEPLMVLATVAAERGEMDRSEALHREALEILAEHVPPDDPTLISRTIQLGWMHVANGDVADAESVFRNVLAVQRRRHGPEHVDVATALHYLGYALRISGRFDEADRCIRDALAMRRRLLGDDNGDVATTLRNLAALEHDRGRFDTAEPLYLETLAMYRRHRDPEHPAIATTLDNYGCLLRDRGDLDRAIEVLNEGWTSRERSHGDVAISRSNLGATYVAQGRLEAAEVHLEAAFDEQLARLAPGDPYLADTLLALGALRVRQGRAADAEPLLLEGLAIRRATCGSRTFRTADALTLMGECRAALGETGAARHDFDESLRILVAINEELPHRRARVEALIEGLDAAP